MVDLLKNHTSQMICWMRRNTIKLNLEQVYATVVQEEDKLNYLYAWKCFGLYEKSKHQKYIIFGLQNTNFVGFALTNNKTSKLE